MAVEEKNAPVTSQPHLYTWQPHREAAEDYSSSSGNASDGGNGAQHAG
eukprot:CAMPEP_0181389108 /NCGR_PEP_ID=MMETSP1106-20121128/24709_1 /TAXON_ID=81844 /ORGANISM="Mantoniella antarctica, Strain SL-175" /LENGTH=47 /DNA_ID= /DNA_START= /DNA_END= /DNA_ORIENTATION=